MRFARGVGKAKHPSKGSGEKVRKCKDGWKHFAALTRRPPRAWPFGGGAGQPPAKLAALREYAAADAWATLRIYEVIARRPQSGKAPR